MLTPDKLRRISQVPKVEVAYEGMKVRVVQGDPVDTPTGAFACSAASVDAPTRETHHLTVCSVPAVQTSPVVGTMTGGGSVSERGTDAPRTNAMNPRSRKTENIIILVVNQKGRTRRVTEEAGKA